MVHQIPDRPPILKKIGFGVGSPNSVPTLRPGRPLIRTRRQILTRKTQTCTLTTTLRRKRDPTGKVTGGSLIFVTPGEAMFLDEYPLLFMMPDASGFSLVRLYFPDFQCS